VIAAAGSGERLGAGGPKAFIDVAGRPLIEWSLTAFGAAESVGATVVAAPPGDEARVLEIASAEGLAGVEAVAGGASRSESVANAIESVSSEIAVVHDAARPLVTAELIDAVVDRLADDPDAAGVIAATPVTDTVKEVVTGREIFSTLDRSSMWAAQTPQAFRTEALRKALADTTMLAQATDDAMLVERMRDRERMRGRVLICEAPPENLKVTTALDLRVAELLLGERGDRTSS
jgi:2-C-methyl-D-erythritol 4-phosphate cytidylyltransferase